MIASAIVMRFGFVIITPGNGKTRIESVRDVLRDAGKILILIIPLLLIAAIIEVTVSARLAEMIVN